MSKVSQSFFCCFPSQLFENTWGQEVFSQHVCSAKKPLDCKYFKEESKQMLRKKHNEQKQLLTLFFIIIIFILSNIPRVIISLNQVLIIEDIKYVQLDWTKKSLILMHGLHQPRFSWRGVSTLGPQVGNSADNILFVGQVLLCLQCLERGSARQL